MTDTPAPEPTRLCQKCRRTLPLERFPQVPGLSGHLCRECLKALGYRMEVAR